MNKGILILVLALGIGIGFSGLSFAEEMQGGQEGESRMGGGHGKGKMMGMGMMQNSVVATSDGGIIILQGPRLIKYDKDLTLVKEVELPRGKKPQKMEDENEGKDPEAPTEEV